MHIIGNNAIRHILHQQCTIEIEICRGYRAMFDVLFGNTNKKKWIMCVSELCGLTELTAIILDCRHEPPGQHISHCNNHKYKAQQNQGLHYIPLFSVCTNRIVDQRQLSIAPIEAERINLQIFGAH